MRRRSTSALLPPLPPRRGAAARPPSVAPRDACLNPTMNVPTTDARRRDDRRRLSRCGQGRTGHLREFTTSTRQAVPGPGLWFHLRPLAIGVISMADTRVTRNRSRRRTPVAGPRHDAAIGGFPLVSPRFVNAQSQARHKRAPLRSTRAAHQRPGGGDLGVSPGISSASA